MTDAGWRKRVACLIATITTGCCFGGSAPPDPISLTEPPAGADVVAHSDPDGLFVYAPAERTRGAVVPPRLRAPIPSSVDAFRAWPDSAPPRAQLERRLCAGDRETVSAWLAAAEQAARSAPVADVAVTFASAARYCEGALPRELRARLGEPRAPGARETALYALARAGADEDEAVVTAADAPPSATVVWVASRAYDHALTPALATRALAALEAHLSAVSPTGDILDPCGADSDAAVRELGDAGRAGELVAMHGRLSGFAADCLALGLGGVADDRAQAAFREACPRMRHPGACERHTAPEPRPDEPAAARPRSVDEEVRSSLFDPASVPRTGPRFDAVVGALASCAVREDDYVARQCSTQLAALDRARAVAAAREWLASHPGSGEEGGHARALDHFAERGSPVAYLRDLGFFTAAAAEDAWNDAVSPEAVLFDAARATMFDTETGQFPNEHDALLVELSALAPGALGGVLFEEIVAGTPGGVDVGGGLIADSVDGVEGEDPEGAYVLRAYDGDDRYEVVAENLGDWYDVDAVVGLLNTLAFARGSDTRWLLLQTGGQEAIVAAGPADGLRQAVTDGWLVPAGRGVSEAARDHEQELIEELFRRGVLDDE